jgi:predicted nicotinamide N-methyase
VLSSYLTTLADSSNPPTNLSHLPSLPILENVLSKKNLNILELGAGCGIVGITLATYFPTSRILLTDLPEATSILTHNLSPLPPSLKITHQILDWSQPLPSDTASQSFDLVVVADCTYNPDVVPDLVNTLRGVAEGNRDVLVLVAMKVRHETEMVFFDLMTESGFVVKGKGGIPLPVLEGEDERIEIYGFQRGV